MFVPRPIKRASMAESHFWWLQAQVRCPDTPRGYKNSHRGGLESVGRPLDAREMSQSQPQDVAAGITRQSRQAGLHNQIQQKTIRPQD